MMVGERDRSLLVTGGAGFVGSNFVRHWRSAHPVDRIVVLDLLTARGDEANLGGLSDVVLVHGDIADGRLVTTIMREAVVDTVVDFTARTPAGRSTARAQDLLCPDVAGVQALIEAVREGWAGAPKPNHRFHQVSTDPGCAAREAAADELVDAGVRTNGFPATISHASTTYGPRQHPGELVPRLIIAALHGRLMPIGGDGPLIRDWLFVDDHCDGIARILERGRAGEHYAITGGCERSTADLVDTLCTAVDDAFTQRPELARRYPSAPVAHGTRTATLKRFNNDGSNPRRKIGTGLGSGRFERHMATTVRWYLDHPQWWRPILARPHHIATGMTLPFKPVPVHVVGAYGPAWGV